MTAVDRICGVVQGTVTQVMQGLVCASHWPDCSFVSMPLVYPDGSDVTVKVFRAASGLRVTDNELAFQSAVAHGLNGNAFVKLAARVTEGSIVKRHRRSLFLDTDEAALQSAISEVAQLSWRLAHQAITPYDEANDESEGDLLVQRLVGLFGKDTVAARPSILGASTNPWRLTALVTLGDTPAAFQQVGGSQYSVYRTSAAFNDIADLESPPKLVAVVGSKAALGTKLNLISRSGYVVEDAQTDDVFLRVAA